VFGAVGLLVFFRFLLCGLVFWLLLVLRLVFFRVFFFCCCVEVVSAWLGAGSCCVGLGGFGGGSGKVF